MHGLLVTTGSREIVVDNRSTYHAFENFDSNSFLHNGQSAEGDTSTLNYPNGEGVAQDAERYQQELQVLERQGLERLNKALQEHEEQNRNVGTNIIAEVPTAKRVQRAYVEEYFNDDGQDNNGVSIDALTPGPNPGRANVRRKRASAESGKARPE